ncbi:MAG: polysaccharide export protein [Verrucomicrobiales bacterium]|nr:polysaccharide export protein [Verrucomicrobiales bacterium]
MNNSPTTRLFAFRALLFSGLIGCVFSVAAVDKIEAHKKSKEEFLQAQRAAEKKQLSTDTVQRDLDRLTEQKTLWEKEIVYAKSKLSYASAQLEKAAKVSAAEDVDRWKRDVATFEARLKASETELAKTDSEIQAAIQGVQRSLKENYDNSLILPGESIEVVVLEDDSLNGLYQVRRGGYIIMPRVGRISLAGKDAAGAEKAIKDALQVNQIKDSTVMVERPQAGSSSDGAVIYLAGEFVHAGPWKIPQGIVPSAVTSVLRSGGTTQSADLTKVRILRLVSGQPLVEEVNVQAILDGVGLNSDLTLNPGDIVMIPAFANVVYVTGNVMNPNTLKLLPDDELTAYSAILRCGGFSRFANRKKVYVLRDRSNGAKQKIPVSIKELQDGKGSDVVLEPKDIVVVPEKFFSF